MTNRLARFSLAQTLRTQLGKAESGYYLRLKVFGFTLFKYQLFDFTASASRLRRMNQMINRVNLDNQIGFAYFEEGLKTPIAPWRRTIIANHIDEASAVIQNYELNPQDRQYFKQRQLEYAEHRKYFYYLKQSQTTNWQYPFSYFQDQGDYIFHSLDSLFAISLPSLKQLEALLTQEIHSCWWRRWLAKPEQVNCYQQHCREYLSKVKQLQLKIAISCFTRLQAALKQHDFVSDDVIYHYLTHHDLNLKRFPIRQGLSLTQLIKINQVIHHLGDAELLKHYRHCREQHQSFFQQLNAFHLIDDKISLNDLRSYLPHRRYWPNWIFFIWNRCFDFFYEKNRQALMLNKPFPNQRLPIISLLQYCKQLQALKEEHTSLTESSVSRLLHFTSFYQLREHWKCYISKEIRTIEQSLAEQCEHLDPKLITPHNQNLSTLLFAHLKSLIPKHSSLSKISNRLNTLEQTPTRQHDRVQKIFQDMIDKTLVEQETMDWLLAFSQQATCNQDDFPHDPYSQIATHRKHFQDFCSTLRQLIEAENQPYGYQHLTQRVTCLLTFDHNSDAWVLQYLCQHGLNLMDAAMQGQDIQTQVSGLLTLAALSPSFAELRLQLQSLQARCLYPLEETQQQESLWVQRYQLLHLLFQQQLLEDINQCQQNLDDQAAEICFLNCEREYVIQHALSIEKLEQARLRCQQQTQELSVAQNLFQQPFTLT